MMKKSDYILQNEQFLQAKREEDGVHELRGGVLYKVIEEGCGKGEVKPRSIVSCFYRGQLINGKVFDDAFQTACPTAFRVNELISGFQIALVNMHIGDHWQVFIPADMGYGKRGDRIIPGGSTLIFEIKLVAVG